MADSDHLELGADAVIHDTALNLPSAAIIRRRHRWIWPLAALLLFALIAAFVVATNQRVRIAVSNGLTVDIGDPPPVEPVVFQQISADAARAANAAQPFVAGPIPAARPFRLAASFADAERATDCLAANIFYEAGNETIEGQMAVAQVVLNRMRHPAFPKSVCGVVFQGQERRTGCQFSFTCDGSLARQPSRDAWERYRALARSMLSGAVYAPVGLATHYHTDWVRPVWSTKMDKLRAERTHLFFRWSGFWGTPKAFSASSGGAEPVIPKMALLSPAHRTPDTNLEAIMAGLLPEGQPLNGDRPAMEKPAQPLPPVTAEERAKNSFFIQVDRATDPALLADLATRTCAGRDYCKLIGWTDRAMIPKGAEISEAQQAAVAFSFLRNREQGFEKAIWNCTLFPRADKRQCMKGKAAAPLVKPAAKPDMTSTTFPKRGDTP
ncbi:MAG: cell wall hydrolase [Candidatus Nitrotoga sp.]